MDLTNPMELWAVIVTAIAMCSVIIVIVLHIFFAVAVFGDAKKLQRKPIFESPFIWFLATLLGGVFAAGIYWLMHHSRLNQSVVETPPEHSDESEQTN